MHRFFFLTNSLRDDNDRAIIDPDSLRPRMPGSHYCCYYQTATALTTQHIHYVARLSSTAIGGYLCSTLFPLRGGCYGCVDQTGV